MLDGEVVRIQHLGFTQHLVRMVNAGKGNGITKGAEIGRREAKLSIERTDGDGGECVHYVTIERRQATSDIASLFVKQLQIEISGDFGVLNASKVCNQKSVHF